MTSIALPSGKLFSLVSPQIAYIDFDEIAEGLGERRRYGPLMKLVNWTVAQHTVLCLSIAPREAWPYVALHDAPEHYLGDDITPKKQALLQIGGTEERGRIAYEVYREQEERIARAIHARAGLLWPMPHDIHVEVETADRRAYNAEVTWLMPSKVAGAFTLFDVDPVDRAHVRAASQCDAVAVLKSEFAKLPMWGEREATEVPFG